MFLAPSATNLHSKGLVEVFTAASPVRLGSRMLCVRLFQLTSSVRFASAPRLTPRSPAAAVYDTRSGGFLREMAFSNIHRSRSTTAEFAAVEPCGSRGAYVCAWDSPSGASGGWGGDDSS